VKVKSLVNVLSAREPMKGCQPNITETFPAVGPQTTWNLKAVGQKVKVTRHFPKYVFELISIRYSWLCNFGQNEVKRSKVKVTTRSNGQNGAVIYDGCPLSSIQFILADDQKGKGDKNDLQFCRQSRSKYSNTSYKL